MANSLRGNYFVRSLLECSHFTNDVRDLKTTFVFTYSANPGLITRSCYDVGDNQPTHLKRVNIYQSVGGQATRYVIKPLRHERNVWSPLLLVLFIPSLAQELTANKKNDYN